MANSADPDQILHNAVSDLGLHGLSRLFCPNISGYYGTLKFEKQIFSFRSMMIWCFAALPTFFKAYQDDGKDDD